MIKPVIAPFSGSDSIMHQYFKRFLRSAFLVLFFLSLTIGLSSAYAQDSEVKSCFDIAQNGHSVPLYISQQEYPGAQRAMGDLQSDLRKLTQNQVDFLSTGFPEHPEFILAGTLGKNPKIDALVESGKLDPSFLEGAWEAYHIEVIENPFEGVDKALVIAGSDKRGTIFGIYEVSRLMGVSPWYFWADVPVPQKENISLNQCLIQDKPKVEYRGIFLNDENPALYGWVHETYGGFNHEFYGDVFELILRLKGNYLWTAMWGKAFYDDDPLNASTADMYGVVIGTTHHEPMGRAHVEWDRYGEGDWNYQTNEEFLREFWKKGIQRLSDYEATITLGMRGDGDMAMSEEANVGLLERIVADQREIIDEYSEQDPDKELQLWALYKEVQEYYEKGMRTPDDVMLLLADDNWGNARLLPEPGKADEHPGGWGLYYHFDYVGGPRNYKWINTNQISRTWEQMNLAWEHGVDRMWLVNVGDLKPMEYPISFFLDHAWDPDEMDVDAMDAYPETWAASIFGEEYAEEIGSLMTEYTLYNARRKHELLNTPTYSLVHFNEGERIVNDFRELEQQAIDLGKQIDDEYWDAYYQLVLHPIEASANLNDLYIAAAKNKWYAQQGRAATNLMAAKVQKLFDRDQEITDYYHNELANGKWNHMMAQTHIGYTYWQQPEQNNIPETEILELPDQPEMGVSVQGAAEAWPGADGTPALPTFDKFNQQSYFFEIFNKGKGSFKYTIETSVPWIEFEGMTSTVDDQQRIHVSLDWSKVPAGEVTESFTIKSDGAEQTVEVHAFNPETNLNGFTGFVEARGYIAMEGENYSKSAASDQAEWTFVPQIGKTDGGMTVSPTTVRGLEAGSEESPRLEYNTWFFSEGEVEVELYLSPTLEFNQSKGLQIAVSFDNEDPQIIDMHDDYNWYQIVGENILKLKTTHTIQQAGAHTLKVWAVDGGPVVQRVVVKTGDVGQTYLGPPESFIKK